MVKSGVAASVKGKGNIQINPQCSYPMMINDFRDEYYFNLSLMQNRYYSVHKSCRLGFRGTRVSYQFNIRHYVCRNVPLLHFCMSILLIPGYQEYFHRHVTPIPQTSNSFRSEGPLRHGTSGRGFIQNH
jgi:hypothetical protein